MDKAPARVWAMTVAAAVTLVAGDASALLCDDVADRGEPELVFFYPYPTSYRQVDPGYAFADDPLVAFFHKPYEMPIEMKRGLVRRVMVEPRTSFVSEMIRSTEGL